LRNTKKELTKFVAFREKIEIVELMDKVTKAKGMDRSDFIREAVRKRLADLGFLDEDKKALESQG